MIVDVVGGSHFLNGGLRKQKYVDGTGTLIHQTLNETIAPTPISRLIQSERISLHDHNE